MSNKSENISQASNAVSRLLSDVPIPRVVKVRQSFERPIIEDVGSKFAEVLNGSGILESVTSGMTIAVGVGSRGIANQPQILRLLLDEIKSRGASPFIVPAMGSHGGATASGQKNMLEGMGIAESTMGAPVRATMEVVTVGESANGLPVSVDRLAYEADGVVVINRIKPHVAFRGNYESGLMKMMAIGLGKQRGAEICHESGFGNMAVNIPSIARSLIESVNIIGAIALVENAYHETCGIEVVKKERIEELEPKLLDLAKALSAKIHFDEFDVLIIDEIGKDISGTGFDTNVVGRYHTPFAHGGPAITRLSVLDLTEASHGNANGVGIADFTTRRLLDKMRFDQTYPNSLTTTVPASVKIPMVLANDREAIQAAIRTCNIGDKRSVRLVRIKNTVNLDTIEVSANLADTATSHPAMEVIGAPYPLEFDDRGNLI